MKASNTTLYTLGPDGEFIIENYNTAKPFASFFPGIAGPHGIPMWLFYVNRGQCVCSMGVEDKEHPIMEFLSANRAYQLAGTQGFRTFIKIIKGKQVKYYEPFQNHLADAGMKRIQRMIIRPGELTLVEENKTLGLKFEVDYYNVPEDNYAGLVRILRVTNLGKNPIRLEGLDGLPLIIPYGVDNINLKNMRRLVESFVEVTNYGHRVPYFKGKVKQEDRPEVIRIKEGNFYLGFEAGAKGARIITPIVDPEFIFDRLTDYSYPARFLSATPYKLSGKQVLENRLPCAMGLFTTILGAKKVYTYASVIGHADSEETLNRKVPVLASMNYLKKKRVENCDLLDRLTQNNFAHSSSPAFDLYTRQNFLDNVLRGGFPISLPGTKTTTTLHLYSRKHGDLERDYNDYRLSPTQYSQGNGNFRDVNQNRRSDLFFNPRLEESSVRNFYNLMQLDGFNPLVVKATSFSAEDELAVNQVLEKAVSPDRIAVVKEFFKHRFAPGELLAFLTSQGITLKVDTDLFLGELLEVCQKHQETDYGHGYWSDHWIYNLDLLENYLAIYPEKLRWVLMEDKSFTFFDNPFRVVPRRDKYVIWDNNPMQLNAVVWDKEKENLIRQRGGSPYEARTQFGQGEIYRTDLFNKLFCLVVNKLASLDPEGVGIEMESDKPNWYDALNGLPGQLGSSISETLELKRTILFLQKAFRELAIGEETQILMGKEYLEFMQSLQQLLKNYFAGNSASRDFEFWDQAATTKERYRELIRLGLSGQESPLRAGTLAEFLNLALKKIEAGLQKAWDPETNLLYTYFMNKVVEHEPIMQETGGVPQVKRNAKGLPCFQAKKFKQIRLPLFLEGPVHYLRISQDQEKSRLLVKAVRSSGLFDRKLKMFKVNESLEGQPMEIGRTKIFSRGWLENESIWMHMEYKYMLELLRGGLYGEFFQDFKNVFVPFLDPAVYGRSILENSSFIASSANPDPAIHGNGFVARLSGSTAEFIHIFYAMSMGDRPFTLNDRGELQIEFKPVLPNWLFSRQKEIVKLWRQGKLRDWEFPAGSYSFIFLSNMLVTYHNPKKKNTFGPDAAGVRSIILTQLDGKKIIIDGGIIRGELAASVRSGEITDIDLELG